MPLAIGIAKRRHCCHLKGSIRRRVVAGSVVAVSLALANCDCSRSATQWAQFRRFACSCQTFVPRPHSLGRISGQSVVGHATAKNLQRQSKSLSGRASNGAVDVEAPTKARDWDLFVFLASQFVLFVAVGAIVPVLPFYGKQFGLASSSVGLIVSSPTVAKLALNLPMGRLADSAGRRLLMVVGMAVCSLADVGTGLATTLPALILARLVLGVGISSSDAGASAWVADATQDRPDSRASFLGVQNAVIALAFVLGPAVGGILVDQFGMSSVFFAVGAAAAVCGVGYATLPEMWRASEEQGDDAASFQELLASPNQQAIAGVSVGFYCGTACKISLIPSIASQVFSATPTEVGQVFSFLAALGIVGTLLGGRLTDAVGARNVLFACGSICAAAYLGAATAVHEQSKEAFVACLAVWALFAAVKSPALQAFAIASAPEDRRGAALSVPKTVGDLSYAVAPFLLGAADDRLGPDAALACCGIAFAIGTAVFIARAV